MSYRRLSQDGSLSELEAEFEIKKHSSIGSIIQNPGCQVAVLLTILIVALLILPISILQIVSAAHLSTYKHDSNTVYMQFAQDKAFQSLDRAYDKEWEALTINKTSGGLIYIPKDGINQDKAIISMYATDIGSRRLISI